MRKLLLFGLLWGSYLGNAQTSCESAVPITANGTFTVAMVSGTYSNTCYGNDLNYDDEPMQAVWYAYTPSAGGVVTVSSNLTANPASTDTRLSIYAGSCSELICYTGNDDISGTNYKSSVSFAVGAGVTYYIAWDNNWSDAGFDFTVNLVEQACVQPGLSQLDITNLTTNSATITWESITGDPLSYDFEYGIAGHTAGTGTIMNTTSATVNLTDLNESSNYEFYIRSVCADATSEWVGPFVLALAVAPPYTNNFDDPANVLDGFQLSGFSYSADAQFAHSGTTFLFANTNATTTVDQFAFFRPMILAANEQVTVSFQSWYLGDEADVANVDLTVGTAATMEAQSTVIGSYTMEAIANDYETYSGTWTAPTAGVYYFALNHNTPGNQVSGGWSVLFDSIMVTSVLSVSEVNANLFSVYPNPTNSVINISNLDNIILTNITISDLNGRVVKSTKVNNVTNLEISVDDLTSGMYMMTIDTDKGSVTKKIVKN